jgi:YHS domain-containing protein
MFRFIVILLGIILVVPLVRSIIGIIMRGFADLLKSESTTPEKVRKPEVPAGGELKKDPVCGTYVSTATALKKTSGAETVYFCSQECRDRFRS